MAVKNKGYDTEKVIYYLNKRGITVNTFLRVIQIPKGLKVGIKTWGMIDFLGMVWYRKGAEDVNKVTEEQGESGGEGVGEDVKQ